MPLRDRALLQTIDAVNLLLQVVPHLSSASWDNHGRDRKFRIMQGMNTRQTVKHANGAWSSLSL